MRRVLKPSGELLFLEHGEAPDEPVRRRQKQMNPIWSRLFGGCNLDQPIPKLIEAAGFEIADMEATYLPDVPFKFASFEYWGAARSR